MSVFSVTQAKSEQERLRTRVVLQPFTGEVRYVGGTDVGFKQQGRVTRAVVTILTYPDLTLLEKSVVEEPTLVPYIPGYLSFRELPALLRALDNIKQKPDLMLCDGQGLAHPRRFGLACHFGVVTGIPTIGVAKKRLIGEFQMPEVAKGSVSPLLDKSEQLGWVVRSRENVKPLYISPGHCVGMQQCLTFVLRCCTRYRLPEPTRLADKITKQCFVA